TPILNTMNPRPRAPRSIFTRGQIKLQATRVCPRPVACAQWCATLAADANGAAMAILIRDTTVVTVDRLDTIHHDAAVAIEGDRIVAVGPSDELAVRFAGATAVDGAGGGGVAGFST